MAKASKQVTSNVSSEFSFETTGENVFKDPEFFQSIAENAKFHDPIYSSR